MARAYSASEIQRMRIPRLEWSGEWAEAFGYPERTGMWIVWGGSGNGKSSFAMQLAKELCKHGSVLYNTREEGIRSLSYANTLRRFRMEEERGRFKSVDLELSELCEMLDRQRSADFVIIDSLQYTGIKYAEYKTLKARYRNKLIVWISHEENARPEGRVGVKVQYDASVKIRVQGYRAYCKGRFTPSPGAYYTIWAEGAASYWLDQTDTKTEQPN